MGVRVGHPGRVDLDQHFTRARRRVVEVGDPEYLGPTELGYLYSSHAANLPLWRRRCGPGRTGGSGKNTVCSLPGGRGLYVCYRFPARPLLRVRWCVAVPASDNVRPGFRSPARQQAASGHAQQAKARDV
ncbi:hypothetical protein GCM10027456_53110 [Kineosporia babensis]